MATNITAEEFATILASYNEATSRLQQSHDVLRGEVRRLREELAHKNRQLERRKRLAALGEMAAGLAHEIRNPLGGIRLYADLLRRDLDGRDGQVELVDKIINGVRNLDGLVSQVLAMTHAVEPKLAQADLVAIVNTAIELLQDQFGENATQLSCRSPAMLELVCDRDMLQRAILNVLRNAVEAAGAGGHVVVNLSRSGGRAIVQIGDDGAGVGPEIADRIFNPFFTTKNTGTGLGLAIVHRIVEAHDGSVTVSRSDWSGALFSITLPLRAGADPRDDQGRTDGNDRGH